MKLFKLVAVLALAVSLQAAGTTAQKQFAADLKAEIAKAPAISPAKLMKWIKEEKKFVLVDVRTSEETSEGVIDADNLKMMQRGKLEFMAIKAGGLKMDDTIVIYCKAGSRGALATNMLKKYGYKNVYNLTKGIKGWLAAGYPITTSLGDFTKVK